MAVFYVRVRACVSYYVSLYGTVDVTEWSVEGFLYDVLSFT